MKPWERGPYPSSTPAATKGSGTARSVPTVQIDFEYSPDLGPAAFRIGLITLSTDHLMEYEFTRIVSDPEISFHAMRVQSVNPITIDNLRTMGPHLTAVTRLLPLDELDAIGYYCTSGTVANGEEAVLAAIRAAKADIPVITPIGAAVAGMRLLDMQRISLITPYVDSVNQMIRIHLESAGFEVLNIASFCIESDLDMYRLPPEAIREGIVRYTDKNADGTFVSCTAIRAAETIDAAEQALQRPVLSAGQAFFWHLLRSVGYHRRIENYGRLFQR